MEKEIDCRGLSCPAPVLNTKELIEKEAPDYIRVLVDNESAKENVSRFLGSQNFEVSIKDDGGTYIIEGKNMGQKKIKYVEEEKTPDTEKKILIMITTDRIGHGDDELGSKLMLNFLKTVKEMGSELWKMVFINNGVKLTVTGAEALSILQELEHSGVHLMVCGTCLGHFNLLDKKQVGETTNMLDIVTSLQLADKVINI